MTFFTVNFVVFTLLKPKTRIKMPSKKWNDYRTSRHKIETIKTMPTGNEKIHYLQQIWKQEQMSSLKNFLRWYCNKDVVPTLEAMQEMFAFYHEKDIDVLKLGFTLTNLANISLHKSTDAKIYPFNLSISRRR